MCDANYERRSNGAEMSNEQCKSGVWRENSEVPGHAVGIVTMTGCNVRESINCSTKKGEESSLIVRMMACSCALR
jgi:hypothetical protein